MNVDLWFNKQNQVVKIILIILPIVGWIMEVLIRISVYLRQKNNMDLVLLILFLLLGWSWIPLIIDVIYLATKDHLFLGADFEDFSKTDPETGKQTVEAEKKEDDK